jgi:hypothetical protein
VLAAFPVAIWLTGSRSAYIGIACALVLVAMVRRRWAPRRGVVIAGLALILVAGLATSIGPDAGAQGSARGAIDLRSQFTRTSARMFASDPLFGVGVGHYFNRSAEFMTPELKEIYGNENAHNYFAQQFAELGVVGGMAFLWLVGSVVWVGWRSVRHGTNDPASLGLIAGAIGYLVTCMTGHPLLVPEAALPFWAALGTVAATPQDDRGSMVSWTKLAALAASGLLVFGVARETMAGMNAAEVPPDAGFHGLERYTDGTEFSWMTRHSVTYIPGGAGFLRLRLRGPDRNLQRPLILETSVAGQVVDRRSVEVGVWVTFEIPVRPSGLPFRRVDFRTNQVWPDEVLLGQRSAIRPVTIMTAELSWVPAQ